VAAVKSNAEEVARKIAAVAFRAKDMSPAMGSIAAALTRVNAKAIRATRSPSGEAWAPLAESTLEGRKRKGDKRGELKALRGDTGAMIAQMTITPGKNFVTMNSNARSAGGYPYWLTHQFGTNKAGRGNNTTIPRRAFFPLDLAGDKLAPMEGGDAATFFARVKQIVLRFITKGKV
jgi:phage gpG-like protein